ncbi:MAG: AEC family transporter [Clostridia bacterium]|nr:AEC family transporter [Clostridia bacterium]
MESLIFAFSAVIPLVALVALGYFLKKGGLMDEELAKKLNRLVFRVFLPTTLFLNVYKIEKPGDVAFGYIVYALAATLGIFLVSLGIILLIVPQNSRRGALVQVAFRSNYALVGIPLAQSLFGDEGVGAATLLSAMIIPMFNILAVITLSIFREDGEKTGVMKVVKGVTGNPLIRAIFLGLAVLVVRAAFVRAGIDFRLSQIEPLFKVAGQLSGLSTPRALLVLGAQFEFSTASELKREITIGILFRSVIVPALGLGIAYLFFRDTFSGAHFASLVAVFATPVAVSSVPMIQEMNGDVKLMGQLVVWTTLFSAISVFLASFLLKLGGVF